MYTGICLVCGKEFSAQRSTRRYCSNVCNQRAYVLRKKSHDPEYVTYPSTDAYRERRKVYMRAWRRANPDKIAQYSKNRTRNSTPARNERRKQYNHDWYMRNKAYRQTYLKEWYAKRYSKLIED